MGDFSQGGPVVVGVEGTERSADALALADVLASTLGSSIVIAFVHPYGRLSSLLSGSEYEQLVREVSEKTFPMVRERLRSVSERRMELIAEESPAAGLHALAEREQARVIVIGSSRRSRLGRVFPGGTGERLLSGASAPVAVAPAGHADSNRSLRTLGCGFDGAPESERALAWAAALARRASAQLRVIAVHQPLPLAGVSLGGGPPTASASQVLRRQLDERVQEAVAALSSDVEASAELTDGYPDQVLRDKSAELDLLVLGSRGYGPLRAVLLGSVSSGLVRSAASPLVVVPRGAEG
jgi:nucleotide-binding universal stress UspA family protein